MGKSNLVVVRLNMKCFAKSSKALGLQDEEGTHKWLPFSQISDIGVNEEVAQEFEHGEKVNIGDTVNDVTMPEWLAKVHDLRIIVG